MKQAFMIAGIVLVGLGLFFYFDSTFHDFGRDLLLFKYWCGLANPEVARMGETFDYILSERGGPLILGVSLCVLGLIAELAGVFGFRRKA